MSSQDTAGQEPITFTPPFDDEDADVILRSSDNAYFAVFRPILAKASPVFADMFAVPGGCADGEKPVVDLTEDKTAILMVLQFCYPNGRPSINTLDDMCVLIDACEEYSMDGIQEDLGNIYLRQFLEQEPLRVYALAMRTKSPAMAIDAARQCLHMPLSYMLGTYITDFRHIPVSSYQGLLNYYHVCRIAAASVITCREVSWLVGGYEYCWVACSTCPFSNQNITNFNGVAARRYKQWWGDFLDEMARSLTEQPHPIGRISTPLKSAVPGASTCAFCMARYQIDLNHFLPKLQAQIEKVISDVSAQLSRLS